MTQHALFDLHLDFIGFRIMDQLVNVEDIGRPFHQQPIPRQTAHFTSGRFPLEPSLPSPHQHPESEMWSSRLLRWLGPVPRLYPYVRNTNRERPFICGNRFSVPLDLLSRRLPRPNTHYRPRLPWSVSRVKGLVESIEAISRSLRAACTWDDKFATSADV